MADHSFPNWVTPGPVPTLQTQLMTPGPAHSLATTDPFPDWDDSSTDGGELFTCQASGSLGFKYVTWMPLVATILIIVLKLGLSHGWDWKSYFRKLPSVLVPLNLLDGGEKRFAYGAACGLLTYHVMYLLIQGFYWPAGHHWSGNHAFINALVKIANLILLCISFYPIFACLTAYTKLLANFTGLFYSLLWGLIDIAALIQCIISPQFEQTLAVFKAVEILVMIPRFMFHATIVFSFVHDILGNLSCTSRRCTKMKKSSSQEYVKGLLKRHLSVSLSNQAERVSTLLRIIFGYERIQGFVFSTKVVCTAVVSGSLLWQLLFFLGILGGYSVPLVLNNILQAKKETFSLEEYEYWKEVLVAFHVIFYIAILIATFVYFYHIFGILSTYRQHTLQLYAGNHTWYKQNHSKLTRPDSKLLASMKYAGLQVMYLTSGWVLVFVALFLVLFLPVTFFFIPLKRGMNSVVIAWIIEMWPLVPALIIGKLQLFPVRKFFLYDNGKTMALRNRRCFHVFNYFMYFYNFIHGIFAAVARLNAQIAIGLCLLCRIDRPVLPSGFEQYDEGFQAYIGMVYIEAAHSHPVMKCFVELLLESVVLTTNGQKLSSTLERYEGATSLLRNMSDAETGADLDVVARKQSRARRRWFKAYTLIRNPQLAQSNNNEKIVQNNVEL